MVADAKVRGHHPAQWIGPTRVVRSDRQISAEESMLLITGLPDIMRKEGWAVAARCMERWFRLGPHALTPDEKTGRTGMDKLDTPTLATDILTMDWAMGFGRVRKVADDLVGKWNTPKGRLELITKVRGWQMGKPLCRKPNAQWDFGDLTRPVAEIDANFEVNYLSVGAMSDPLDDFYGAVGRGTLKLAASGQVTNGTDGQPVSIKVTAVGVYLRDTYDFVGDQFLGLWSETGVNRSRVDELLASQVSIYTPIAIDRAEYDSAVAADRAALAQPIVSPMGGAMMPRQPSAAQFLEAEKGQWHSVANGDFVRYRTKTGKRARLRQCLGRAGGAAPVAGHGDVLRCRR